jgi:hypothetical protein
VLRVVVQRFIIEEAKRIVVLLDQIPQHPSSFIITVAIKHSTISDDNILCHYFLFESRFSNSGK